MELTSVQTMRIFSMYVNTAPVLYEGEEYILAGVDLMTMTLNLASSYDDVDDNWTLMDQIDKCKLSLYSMYELSDTDALEIASIYYGRGHVKMHADTQWKYVAYVKENAVSMLSGESSVFIYQFLVEAGYAVPLYVSGDDNISGKTAIGLGLAVARSRK